MVVLFSSSKKTIYLYPFTDNMGGQDGVQWKTVCRHISVQCCDCVDNSGKTLASYYSLTVF